MFSIEKGFEIKVERINYLISNSAEVNDYAFEDKIRPLTDSTHS